MFNEFVEARAGEAGRRTWAIVVSTTVQAAILLLLILTPLLYTEALPKVWLGMKALLAPLAVPLVEAPKPPQASAERVRLPKRFIDHMGILYAPRSFPAKPLVMEEAEIPPELPAGASTGFVGLDLLNSLSTGRTEAEPPPVTPLPIPRSQIEPAMILSQPQPVYPPLAVIAKIEGDVFLHAIIDKGGRVAELEFVSGNPLLARAALDAVRNWRYRPTLVSGGPVEVETTIKVSFVLGR